LFPELREVGYLLSDIRAVMKIAGLPQVYTDYKRDRCELRAACCSAEAYFTEYTVTVTYNHSVRTATTIP